MTKGAGDFRVKLWVGGNGEDLTNASETLDMTLPRRSRVLFGEDVIQFSKNTYYETGNPSCWDALGFGLVWEFLGANKTFDAEFRVKAKSQRRYRHILGLLRKEIKEVGGPIDCVKFVYGGKDKGLEGSTLKLASITVSFVTKSSD